MTMEVEMGKTYFALDNTTETQEPMIEFFKSLGLDLFERVEGFCGYSRESIFTNHRGFMFSVIWYRNLAKIRIGEWGGAFVEIDFTSIRGSYLSRSDHMTFDFYNGNDRTGTLSIAKAGE